MISTADSTEELGNEQKRKVGSERKQRSSHRLHCNPDRDGFADKRQGNRPIFECRF
jgi:hypothetical protein